MKQINGNLSDEQKKILIDGGTEPPFSDKSLLDFSEGIYSCANCGNKLFNGSTKYESKIRGLIGWPSFDKAIEGSVEYRDDNKFSMNRTEVLCSKCGGRLGHVFSANDSPTGTHFCINSLSLDFKKSKK